METGSRIQSQTVTTWRFWLAIVLWALAALLLVARVMALQVLDTKHGYRFLTHQGDIRSHRTEIIPAYRGMIVDRHGEPLAVSTPVISLWMDPQQLVNQSHRWQSLAEQLEWSISDLEEKIASNRSRRFVYLRRHMVPDDAQSIIDLKIPGVFGQREFQRFYPAAEVAAHVVGFTDIDDNGQEGIELAFDDWLQGQAGSQRVLKDLYGKPIRELGWEHDGYSGHDLSLSIDLRLQYLAYRELKTALLNSGAKAGSLVMLDSRTGEVLAMVNQPSFNPNHRRGMLPNRLRNRAVTDVLEPGSTVKPLTIVAALESGQYSLDATIDTSPGTLRVGRKILWDPVNYGVMDLTHILSKSSQVGISKLALSLDEQQVWDVFRRFGLGDSTNSGFPGESAGFLPYRNDWQPIERATFAFGYGLTVTPLQLAQAYAVFANGGKQCPVSLLRRDEPVLAKQVIEPQVAEQLLSMLTTATRSGGTATRAQVGAYSVAGKTGTIHKTSMQGYADDQYVAVFAGVAPASDPRIVTVVVIDEPSRGEYYGGEVAAPVFAHVVTHALRLLDVVPDKGVALTVHQQQEVQNNQQQWSLAMSPLTGQLIIQ